MVHTEIGAVRFVRVCRLDDGRDAGTTVGCQLLSTVGTREDVAVEQDIPAHALLTNQPINLRRRVDRCYGFQSRSENSTL